MNQPQTSIIREALEQTAGGGIVTKKLNPGWIELSIVSGVEGDALYVNGYRCAGPKPWGGGQTIWTRNVRAEDFLEHVQTALGVPSHPGGNPNSDPMARPEAMG